MRTVEQIGKEMQTQDTRGTARPILYVLEERKRVVAHDDDSHGWDGEAYFDPECSSSFDSFKEWLSAFGEIDTPRSEMKEQFEKQCFKYKWRWEWEPKNWFFTETGFKEHMKLNSHNYHGEVRLFVHHCWRNPEMEAVQEHLLKQGGR